MTPSNFVVKRLRFDSPLIMVMTGGKFLNLVTGRVR